MSTFYSSYGSAHRGRADFEERARRCPICRDQVDLAQAAASSEDEARTLARVFEEPTGFALVGLELGK